MRQVLRSHWLGPTVLMWNSIFDTCIVGPDSLESIVPRLVWPRVRVGITMLH